MPCCAPGSSAADATAAEKLRRATLEKMQRQKLTDMQGTLDALHDLPKIEISNLEKLSITRGPMLDVDNWASPSPNECHSRFFMPFDWPQDWLEYESWSMYVSWMKMDLLDLYSSSNLHFQGCRASWFRARLAQLNEVDPGVWDSYCEYGEIVNHIGLRLPYRAFRSKRHYEYCGEWAYLAKLDTDRSHAACLMLDSSDKVTSDLLLRSEVEAAICMSQYQLRDGLFINHHTKPILVTTIFRDQKARLTQAHFDSKQNKLILRQSRLLDLAGKEPGPDAWLALRWMACTPVGETKYPSTADTEADTSDKKASLPPSITVVSS